MKSDFWKEGVYLAYMALAQHILKGNQGRNAKQGPEAGITAETVEGC